MSESTFRSTDVQLEVRIAAPRAKVWKALTEETVSWWPGDFYVGKEPKGFVVEPKLNGRVYEDWGDGAGALWSTVIAIQPGELLQWVGDMAPEFAGPARSITSFRLRSDGEETVVQFRDSAFGQLPEGVVDGLEKGWSQLLDGCLKPYAETGAQPPRPASVVA